MNIKFIHSATEGQCRIVDAPRGPFTIQRMSRRGRRCLRDMSSSVAVAINAILCLCVLGASAQSPDYLIIAEDARPFCNGTISLNRQCNTTVFHYPSGCPSEETQLECTEPEQGRTCSELPQFNATCLSKITCSSFDFPPNSHRNNDEWPVFGEALEIACDTGYERADTQGFQTKAYCTDRGNFTEMDARDFECVPVICGRYCRYCLGTYTQVTTDPKVVLQYEDEFGERCCLTRPNPLFDNSADGRNTPNVANGQVLQPWSVRLGEKVKIECDDGYDAVPSWGFLEPECVPRTDCTWVEPPNTVTDKNGWNEACRHVRGRYETGAVCKRILSNVSFSYVSFPQAPCELGATECEFPESVSAPLSSLTACA
jgi:hypothetical protein